MAMACFLLVTLLPLRRDLSVPFFLALISVSTLLLAAGEYFLPDDFLDALRAFLADVVFFLLLAFLVLLFFAVLDFFFAAFLVAMNSSSSNSDVRRVNERCLIFKEHVGE